MYDRSCTDPASRRRRDRHGAARWTRDLGTGDPVFGTFPGDLQLRERRADGFVADQAWRDALGERDLGGEGERPDAGVLAESTRALMQYGTQLRATGEAEHRVGVLGAGGPGLQGRQATLVKIVQGIVDGLVSAVEVVRNR